MTVREILSDPVYSRLKAYVLNHTGLAYYSDKDEDFATRIARRVSDAKAPNCAVYLAMLERAEPKPSEIDALVGELTIGETYFFRQSEHFEFLRSTIFPELLERKNDKKLRIWSAGCATGAEPYSIAVLLNTEFAGRIQGWDVSILGTDINPGFLAQARAGIYTDWALRDVSDEVKNCCFRHEAKRWVFSPQFREAVTFRYHNLADDSPPPAVDGTPFDIILCRNVMIYFSPERNRAVAAHLFQQLSAGGWLLVGHAESSAEVFEQFQLVRAHGVTAYRKPFESSEAEPQPNVETPVWIPWTDLLFAPTSASAPKIPSFAADPPASVPAPASTLDDARLHADRGEWAAAEKICRALIDADSLNARAHFMLGLILAHSASVDAAIAELRRAIYIDRRFALAYYHLGTLFQRTACASDSRRAFRNASALLQERAAEDPVEYGDGITAEELRELVRMHQEILGE